MSITSTQLYYTPTAGGTTASSSVTSDVSESTVNGQSTSSFLSSNRTVTVTASGTTVSTNLPVDLLYESTVNGQSTAAYSSTKVQATTVTGSLVTVITTPLAAASNTNDTLQKVQIWSFS